MTTPRAGHPLTVVAYDDRDGRSDTIRARRRLSLPRGSLGDSFGQMGRV